VSLPSVLSIRHRQARVFWPSMFIAQEPQIPSLHDRRKVRVGSISFFILISASKIMGPVLFKSTVYVCKVGFFSGSSGFQRYILNSLLRGLLVEESVSTPGAPGALPDSTAVARERAEDVDINRMGREDEEATVTATTSFPFSL